MSIMKLLVLGGTHFAGRAVVEAALATGLEVTTLNRGLSGITFDGVTQLVADRTDPAALRAALGNAEWDAVIDTWSGAPAVIATSCQLLAGRVGHFGYVSSVSVVSWPVPVGADEQAPMVDGDPDSDDASDYAAAKRGAELAVLRTFGDRALLARAGLILGPYENIGRLPWWLRRAERGGRVLAPGDPARSLQYIDVRDLAAWLVSAARRQVGGAFNAISPPGHTTMGELLDEVARVAGALDAELVWVPQKLILDAGISPWMELPIWVPQDEEFAGFMSVDVSAAHAAGLSCRPVRDTVTGTWAWLQAEGDPKQRPDRPSVGLDPAKEREVLAALTGGPA
jgi:nucleoside-diphosphate-sugar epimerase